MNTKICKACGQTNFSVAAICSNCRQNLEQTAHNSGGQQETGSNKLYWILGGVGALVLLGVFLIVAVVGGIFYFAGEETSVVKNTNTESNVKPLKENDDNTVNDKPDNEEDSNTDVANINLRSSSNKEVVADTNTGSLEDYTKTKFPYIGKFKLISVSTMEEKSKKNFPNSIDEALALYSSDPDKNPLEIIFSISKFDKVSNAVNDVKNFKKKLSKKKGKILKESNLSDGVIITYQQEGIVGILDCKNKVCADMSGTDGKQVADFYRLVRKK